jgi:PTS system cellobiose-specific IIC component
MGLVLCLVVIAVSGLIFYPFFKMYDKQLLEEEKANEK